MDELTPEALVALAKKHLGITQHSEVGFTSTLLLFVCSSDIGRECPAQLSK